MEAAPAGSRLKGRFLFARLQRIPLGKGLGIPGGSD